MTEKNRRDKSKKNHWGRQFKKDNRHGKELSGPRSGSFEGVISISRRGTGYVDISDSSKGKWEEDIEIPRESLNRAINGDTVKISLLPQVKGMRQRGEVLEVVLERKREFVGTIKKTEPVIVFEADSKRMYVDIIIKKSESVKINASDKVLAKITSWEDPKENPEGEIIEVIGKTGDHETEMRAILLDRGIDWDFPKEITEEAEGVREKAVVEISNYNPKDNSRLDFRSKTTFTIDPVDAKDFDDAISVESLSGGWFKIGIHIADVSHYVKEESELDAEARERGFSVYLVDRTIPMLPEAISNDIASLVPNEERFTYSAVFEINKEGEIRDSWFGKTIIKSDKRFSYEEAQEVLDTGKGPYLEELIVARDIARSLKKHKKAQGAIEFRQDEIKFELDENGKPIGIHKKEHIETHSLIEEFMLLANREVARKIEKDSGGKYPFIYRVHDAPDPEKMAHLGIFLKAWGYDFETKGPVTSKDVQKMLDKVSGTDIESLIEATTLRSMAKAVYSVQNIGHFGLGFAHYTHFTSPIRRYPDLIVHRILEKFFNGKPVSKQALAHYRSIASEASQKELEAVNAERASIKYKQVEYMSEHVGEEFEGRIVGVVEYGFFVEELETLSDGLVPVSSISGDYYVYDKDKFELRGERKGRKYRLGDKVRIKVAETDLESRTITFSLVDDKK